MAGETELLLTIGTLVSAAAAVIMAVVAVMQYRSAKKYRADLETSRKALIELQKQLSKADLERLNRQLNWKMFTDAGKLFLEAYRSGVFDEEEYEG